MAVNSYKTDEQLKEKGKYQTLGRLFAYMLPYKKEIIAVLLMMGYGVVISLINPKIMQRAIDVNIAGHDMHGLVKMLSIALVINLLLVVTIKIRMYIMASHGFAKMRRRIRQTGIVIFFRYLSLHWMATLS